jgi:GNAT superfamily N-acetyltransferase
VTDLLAPGYTIRAPAYDDIERVLALQIASDIEEFGESQGTTLAELRDFWRWIDLDHDAWLVEAADGTLAGYADCHGRHHVRQIAGVFVHPDHFGRGIGTTLVRLTEARAREHVPLAPRGARVVLINGINANNADARALLECEGYVPDRYFLRMEATLDPPPPEPAWPAGITVRAMAADEDGRLFHQVHQEAMADHYGNIPAPFEMWSERHMGETLDRDLWFIAMDGDQPAGVAMCQLADGTGWVGQLAVRRPWRRRGLGLALLRHAAGAFRRRGLTRYALAVDSESPTGATRLYERAGMRVAHTYAGYLKELCPGFEQADAS